MKRSLFIISITGIIFSVIIIFSIVYSRPVESEQSTAFPKQTVLSIRLKIPKINVNAVILSVGLTQDGAMGVPQGPINTAWFNLGPRPGQVGSAVIDGHSGWKNGIPAVFDNLSKLQIGDKIYVQEEKGAIITFIVRQIRNFDPKEDASEVFSSSDGLSHLNLITCGGAWNKVLKSHSQRLVVFTDKE